ncbi:MAG: hypothetical protein BRD38_02865, partial [Bacteroidetes bacterium QH_9_67_14]
MAELAPQLFVIFGATGDLTRRKLMPALCQLVQKHGGSPNGGFHVLGVARSEWSDDDFQRIPRDGSVDVFDV